MNYSILLELLETIFNNYMGNSLSNSWIINLGLMQGQQLKCVSIVFHDSRNTHLINQKITSVEHNWMYYLKIQKILGSKHTINNDEKVTKIQCLKRKTNINMPTCISQNMLQVMKYICRKWNGFRLRELCSDRIRWFFDLSNELAYWSVSGEYLNHPWFCPTSFG